MEIQGIHFNGLVLFLFCSITTAFEFPSIFDLSNCRNCTTDGLLCTILEADCQSTPSNQDLMTSNAAVNLKVNLCENPDDDTCVPTVTWQSPKDPSAIFAEGYFLQFFAPTAPLFHCFKFDLQNAVWKEKHIHEKQPLFTFDCFKQNAKITQMFLYPYPIPMNYKPSYTSWNSFSTPTTKQATTPTPTTSTTTTTTTTSSTTTITDPSTSTTTAAGNNTTVRIEKVQNTPEPTKFLTIFLPVAIILIIAFGTLVAFAVIKLQKQGNDAAPSSPEDPKSMTQTTPTDDHLTSIGGPYTGQTTLSTTGMADEPYTSIQRDNNSNTFYSGSDFEGSLQEPTFHSNDTGFDSISTSFQHINSDSYNSHELM